MLEINCKHFLFIIFISAETTRLPDRMTSFSNWTSTYDENNKVTEEAKSQTSFRPSSIDEHFKKRYHRYHNAFYDTEHHDNMGIHGDIPYQKFFLKNQEKIHSGNYNIGKTTSKPTSFLPGYGGYIPYNPFEIKFDRTTDPYFKVNKTNHMLNYKTRLPGYQGYIPTNPANIKGTSRPYCLSTKGEKFV